MTGLTRAAHRQAEHTPQLTHSPPVVYTAQFSLTTTISLFHAVPVSIVVVLTSGQSLELR